MTKPIEPRWSRERQEKAMQRIEDTLEPHNERYLRDEIDSVELSAIMLQVFAEEGVLKVKEIGEDGRPVYEQNYAAGSPQDWLRMYTERKSERL